MPLNVITQVVTAADSYDLTDLATAKDELTIAAIDTSADAFLSRAITQASSLMASHCNRVFPVETILDSIYPEQDPYPYQTPGMLNELQLSRYPVQPPLISVQQVLAANVTQTLTEGTDFKLDAKRGVLMRLNTFTGVSCGWEALPVIVSYTAGYDPIPDDLVTVCLRLVTLRFSQRGRDPYLTAQADGTSHRSWWVGPFRGQTSAFPPDISAMLDNYKVPLVV